MKRIPIFSVTSGDVEWEFFRSGGKGGQNQNKVESGARCRHVKSGAVGESREFRDQLHNRRAAFRRMGESAMFKNWLRIEVARLLGEPSIDSIVDAQMECRNISVEVRGTDGKWEVV